MAKHHHRPNVVVIRVITFAICMILTFLLVHAYDNTNLGNWIEQNVPEGWWSPFVVLLLFGVVISVVHYAVYRAIRLVQSWTRPASARM